MPQHIKVTINTDGSVTVEDDGRGIPVESALRPGLLHAARRDDRAEVRRQVREGRLSNLRRFARRRRHRGEFPLRVVRGRSLPPRAHVPAGIRTRRADWPKSAASAPPISRGTKTTFKPDSQIFPNTKFVYNTLHKRLQELAFLNRGVTIVFSDAALRRKRFVPLQARHHRVRRALEPGHRSRPIPR